MQKYKEEVFLKKKNMPQISLPRNSHQHLEYITSTGLCAQKWRRKNNRQHQDFTLQITFK